MGKGKDFLHRGFARGAREVGKSITGQDLGFWGLLILAAVALIVMGVAYWFLKTHGLFTGTVFFFVGLLMTWIILKLQAPEERYTLLYIFPFIMFVIGYLLEYAKAFNMGTYISLTPSGFAVTNELTGMETIYLPVNLALTVAVTVCIIIQTYSHFKK